MEQAVTDERDGFRNLVCRHADCVYGTGTMIGQKKSGYFAEYVYLQPFSRSKIGNILFTGIMNQHRFHAGQKLFNIYICINLKNSDQSYRFINHLQDARSKHSILLQSWIFVRKIPCMSDHQMQVIKYANNRAIAG
jgi:hypothetical protein